MGCSAVRNAFGSRAGHGHSVCSAVVTQTDLVLGDGRTLHAYDAAAGGAEGRLGCSGTTARPTSARRPSRCSRPPPSAASAGCRTTGRATADPRPTQAATWRPRAADVASVADALGIERFAVMGHSGGAAHALACAALLPERVLAAVCVSGLAPYHAQGSTGSRAWPPARRNVSVLDAAEAALDWLWEHASHG